MVLRGLRGVSGTWVHQWFCETSDLEELLVDPVLRYRWNP